MVDRNDAPWSIGSLALAGLLGGALFGVLLSALYGDLGSARALGGTVISSAALIAGICVLVAWLRNFMRGL